MAFCEKAGISFSIKRGRTLIYRATLHELGDPEYIRFLFNAKEHKLAVQSCEGIDKEAIKIPNDLEPHNQFEVSSVGLLRIIYRNNQWDFEKTFNISGYSFPKNHLIEYRLSDAAQIRDEEFIDPDSDIAG